VRFYGRAAEFAAQMGCKAVHVSLSHTSDNAIAQVILEGSGR
jgi:phosphopantetheinyl transferase (holo-ACP synthase)